MGRWTHNYMVALSTHINIIYIEFSLLLISVAALIEAWDIKLYTVISKPLARNVCTNNSTFLLSLHYYV